jgi:hypothetical protein
MPMAHVVVAFDRGSEAQARLLQDPHTGYLRGVVNINTAKFLLGTNLSRNEAEDLVKQKVWKAAKDGYVLVAVPQDDVPQHLIDDWVEYEGKIRIKEWESEQLWQMRIDTWTQ